jgi:hypothetical protein
MFRRVRKVLATAGLVLLAGVGVSQPAGATLVVGHFDPTFGGALPGVSFTGTATFTVSQNCLGFSGFVSANFNCGGASSGMGFVSANVNFTNTVTNAELGSVSFGADPSGVLGMYIQNGQVLGIQTVSVGPFEIGPSTSTSLPGAPNATFDLFFGLPHQSILALLGENHPPGPPDGDGDLDDQPASAFQTTSLVLLGCSSNCTSNGAQTTYALPEPGSFALVIGALGAAAGLGGLRRRRVPAA